MKKPDALEMKALTAVLGEKIAGVPTFRSLMAGHLVARYHGERPTKIPERLCTGNPAPAPRKHIDILNLVWVRPEDLLSMGLYPFDVHMWCFPAEWAPQLPLGTPVVLVGTGETTALDQGLKDADSLHGLLPYGILITPCGSSRDELDPRTAEECKRCLYKKEVVEGDCPVYDILRLTRDIQLSAGPDDMLDKIIDLAKSACFEPVKFEEPTVVVIDGSETVH